MDIDEGIIPDYTVVDIQEYLEKSIRNVPDFPKPGIQFKDISTLLADPVAYRTSIEQISERLEIEGVRYTKIAGADARGFLFGAPLALEKCVPFAMVRKRGKLPGKTVSETYQLEYGEDSIEVTDQTFGNGDRVLLVDDLLATGGTLEAMAKLVEKCGAEVAGIAVVVELEGLGGREKLSKYPLVSLVRYQES